ncbi:hypothetical protein Q7P37_007039 [Cladosporium fusiforme]
MLRAIVLLVAALAAIVLAAPAPLPAPRHSSWGSFGKSEGRSPGLHSFKSFTPGHRRHHGHSRDPIKELARVYHKFHWSITLPVIGTISVDLPNATSGDYNFPSDGSSSGSESGASDENSGSAFGSGSGASDDGEDGSSSGSESESSGDTPYGNGSSGDGSYGYGSDGTDSDGTGATPSSIETSVVTAPTSSLSLPPTYATEDPADATDLDAFTSVATFSTRVSATAAPTTTASPSSPENGDDNGESGESGNGDGGNGEVNAHPEENESEYLSPVSIGGQKLNLNFDTGSADLWVFSTSLPSTSIDGHSVFDPSKSSTWEEADGSTWEISYGDGSGASGTVGFDEVNIGGVTATRQAVELATAVSSEFTSDENNDGLLGLAFGKINTIQPRAQKTFFENVAEDLEEKVFTADLDIDASGTYEFGKLDHSKYSGELHTTPIETSRGWWEFDSAAYSIGGKDVQNSNASPAIADTGTSLIMVDDDIAEAFYNQVEGASMSSKAGGYVYPCDADVPSFGVEIGSSGFMAHINGSDIEYAKVGSNTCFGGIQGNGGQGLQIYGAVLLKRYFAVFDFGEMTFSLAEKA